jgi:hypothetical protein
MTPQPAPLGTAVAELCEFATELWYKLTAHAGGLNNESRKTIIAGFVADTHAHGVTLIPSRRHR